MQPHEINPDTDLCTILGYNAQTGESRRYLNKILKQNGINATAIALNITDEHFEFTMRSIAKSKVDKMVIEQEFQNEVSLYCNWLSGSAKSSDRVDFIEVADGKVEGYCLDDEISTLFREPDFVDERTQFVAKMMLIAHRWFGATVDIDDIPLLIEN